VVLSLVLKPEKAYHLHHPCYLFLAFHDNVEVLFDVNVRPKKWPHVDLLVFCLVFKTVREIPVSASHKGVVILFNIGQFLKPFLKILQNIFNVGTSLHHLLRDSS
jgi:hypothetical protein